MPGYKNLFFASLLFSDMVANVQLSAQCNPPSALSCNAVQLLCSLDELNGLACSNAGAQPSTCSPICAQGGAAENTCWWGFAGNGASVTITINVGTCTNSQGLEFGVLRNCKCTSPVACKSVPCVPPGGSESITAILDPCVQYFLWVDGCNGDVCDFTIQTTGGGPPTLPLGLINNNPSRVIQACKGYCSYRFFVDPPGDYCYSSYAWTLDGVDLNHSERNLYLDLPKEGDFQLCVTQQVMNPANFSMVCSEQGPQCATVKVRTLPDRSGPPRTICWETANPKGFKWFNQYIYSSGEYRAKISGSDCCPFDSVVTFKVLDKPSPSAVYYITCNNQPYTDVLGRMHKPCLDNKEIVLNKTTNPYKCDSSILLTAINVDYAPAWEVKCFGSMVELIPNIKILEPCDAGETYEFDYNWYLKKDTTNLISKDERLLVPANSEEYVLKVQVITTIESEIAVCTRSFYETIDEGKVTPACFSILGEPVYCFDQTTLYRMDSFVAAKVNMYNWMLDHGQIISNPDSSAVFVKWTLNPGDTGRICASYTVDCGVSCTKCQSVVLNKDIAGQDFSQKGLSAYLDALPHSGGVWRLISGPHPVRIYEPSNPKTRISAYNYGLYCFEWTVMDNNCTLRDTLCVELYSGKRASPEYPKNFFDFRARKERNTDTLKAEVSTPSLINASGTSYITMQALDGSVLHYSWVSLTGRIVSHMQVFVESATQRMEISSPMESGVYFLQIQYGNFVDVRKVVVIR